MIQWEYLFKILTIDQINQFGCDGWELFRCVFFNTNYEDGLETHYYDCIFKRQKPLQ